MFWVRGEGILFSRTKPCRVQHTCKPPPTLTWTKSENFSSVGLSSGGNSHITTARSPRIFVITPKRCPSLDFLTTLEPLLFFFFFTSDSFCLGGNIILSNSAFSFTGCPFGEGSDSPSKLYSYGFNFLLLWDLPKCIWASRERRGDEQSRWTDKLEEISFERARKRGVGRLWG